MLSEKNFQKLQKKLKILQGMGFLKKLGIVVQPLMYL